MSLERKIFIMQVNWCVLSAIVAICLNCGDVKDDVKNTYRKNTAIDSTQIHQLEGTKDKWVLRNPLPTGSALPSVAFGNGRFVALGASPNDEKSAIVLLSSDGTSWSSHKVNVDRFGKIVFGNGRFVTTGGKGIFYASIDGLAWIKSKKAESHSYPVNDIFFGESLFVAVGDSGLILSSSDGINWVKQQPVTIRNLGSGTYGAGKFVIAGVKPIPYEQIMKAEENQVELGTIGIILVSNDGKNWDATAELPENCPGISSVVYGNGMFIAIAGNRYVEYMQSFDGMKWWWFGGCCGNRFHKLTNVNDMFFPIDATSGGVFYSRLDSGVADCSTWKEFDYYSFCSIQSFAYGMGLYVAVGSPGIILSSQNLSDWKTITGIPANDLISVAFGNGRFVAVGKHGTLLTSPDGITWKVVGVNTSRWFTVVRFVNNQFVVNGSGGDGGAFLFSSDGDSWTTNNFGQPMGDAVVYFNGKYITSYGSSLDGIAWEESKSLIDMGLKSIVSDNKKLVAVNFYGFIYVSYDGINWQKTYSTNREIRDPTLLYKNNKFILYENQSHFDTLFVSVDGLKWGKIGLAKFVAEIQSTEGETIIKDDYGFCLMTPDLRKKIGFEAGTFADIRTIVFGNGRYVAVGNAGTIVTLDSK